MCTANLNVALQPCQHRWYTMLTPCSPTTDLSNCPARVKLQGWEQRQTDCPWCRAEAPLSRSHHRLFSPLGPRRQSDDSILTRQTSRSPDTSRSVSPEDSDDACDDEIAKAARRVEHTRLRNARLDAYIATAAPRMQPSRADSSGSSRSAGGLLGRWGSVSSGKKKKC